MFSTLSFANLHVDLLFQLPNSPDGQPRVVIMRLLPWLGGAARGERVAPDEMAIHSRGQTLVVSAEADGAWSVYAAAGHALLVDGHFTIVDTAEVDRYLQARGYVIPQAARARRPAS